MRYAASHSGRFGLASSKPFQQGQSLTEFVVLALVLVPLFVILPLLGKYMDMSQHAISASRYIAFEAVGRHSTAFSSWKSDEDLEQETRRRFFSTSAAPIKSDDTAGDFVAHRNPIWNDHTGKALIENFSRDVTVHAGQDDFEHPFGAMFARDLSLPQRNLHTATVSVRPVNIKGLPGFNKLDLLMKEHVTLLADPWWVRDGERVTEKITDSYQAFPSRIGIKATGTVHKALIESFSLAFKPLGVEEKFPDIPRVEPNVVPSDRLGEYK